MSIKNTYKRGDTYYYQRKVPLDLKDRYGGNNHVKENLQTSDLATVARKVEALNKHYEHTWDAMRGNRSITPAQVREAATRLLNQYGLNALPLPNTEQHVDLFLQTVLEPKRLQYAEGDEHTYFNAPAADYLSEVELNALYLLLEQL